MTYPGDPGGVVHKRQRAPCPIDQTDTADTEWIADVASRGWLIITRDHRIAHRTRERAVVEAAGAKLIAIGNPEKLNNWGILEVVMSQWHWIERQVDEPGPFIYSITRTTRHQL